MKNKDNQDNKAKLMHLLTDMQRYINECKEVNLNVHRVKKLNRWGFHRKDRGKLGIRHEKIYD